MVSQLPAVPSSLWSPCCPWSQSPAIPHCLRTAIACGPPVARGPPVVPGPPVVCSMPLPVARQLPAVLCAIIPQHHNCHTRSALTPLLFLLCLEMVLCSTVHQDSLPFTLACDFMGLCHSQGCRIFRGGICMASCPSQQSLDNSVHPLEDLLEFCIADGS